MVYLAKTSAKTARLAGVAAISVSLLLAACSSDSSYKREAAGNDKYLHATPLVKLQQPAGISLPEHSREYDIPPVTKAGVTGRQVDIRPPAQPLALIEGTRAQFSGDSASLLLENAQGASLWSQVTAAVKALQYPVAQQNDASQSLSTGWIEWQRKDEDFPYRARYQISVKPEQYQQALEVTLLELQQRDKAVSDSLEIQRYSTLMLNNIAFELDKRETRLAEAKNQNGSEQLFVQSGTDDVGLPVLIVRGEFNTVWHRLNDALAAVGMKVKDASRSQGNMTVSYKPLSASEWQALGARDPGLLAGDYKLQVGDLENRSSLQFIDPKGHAISVEQNEALVAVFQSAFNKAL